MCEAPAAAVREFLRLGFTTAALQSRFVSKPDKHDFNHGLTRIQTSKTENLKLETPLASRVNPVHPSLNPFSSIHHQFHGRIAAQRFRVGTRLVRFLHDPLARGPINPGKLRVQFHR